MKSLKQLNLQPDGVGILRCRGRLGNAHMAYDTKHPMLIASKTELSKAILREAHLPYHCGIAQTMANIRQRFWIPKLRQLVKQVLRLCVPCQKFNNLPFKYPEMDDLPNRRVQRTRPFEHVGIDYFGPLSAKQGDCVTKVYGIIVTCTATRLLHLELVPEMSTEHLLLALRRFFARRGVPASITSDNGPSFLLGEQVLRDAVFPVIDDVSQSTAMTSKGIVWKKITPYAPWQGAFYERLIKSVKQSLYKVLKREIVSVETLETILIEVEGTVNSRPLTYQEERWEDTPLLRPIDFIQRDIIISYPFESISEDFDDAEYLPPDQVAQLRTKEQAKEALRTSHQLTERYWRIWSEHYLRALRETHKVSMDRKKSSALSPSVGKIVLISDPLTPRNSWKLGRILELPCSENGKVREAQLRLPSGRVIRRPINHLVPLELEETPEQTNTSEEEASQDGKPPDEEIPQPAPPPRYDLRPRKPITYEETSQASQAFCASTKAIPTGNFMTCLAILTVLSRRAIAKETLGQMQCISGGAQVTSVNVERYELCAEGYCHMAEHPQLNETISLPPEVLVHEHHIQLKLFDGENLLVLEMTCPPESFCDHVRCWFCTANVFNPQCSPATAIAAIAITLYIAIGLVYVLCYAPMVVGKPCRIIGKAAWIACKTAGFFVWKLLNKLRRNRRRRYDVEVLLSTPLLAIAWVSIRTSVVFTCQDIDVFSHHQSICSFSPKGAKRCTLDTTEVVKLNSFNQEGCIRLLNKQSVYKELRIHWKRLRLTCVKDNIIFTRNTVQRMVDSKRCPHSGTCTNDKCAAINISSLIPELEHGNQYPGTTHCVESCGGPGCGCFYLSSGCLFYRIFHMPTDKKVYEVYQCSQWMEEVELEITVITKNEHLRKRLITVQPTVPVSINEMRITLTALSLPPTPALSSRFISDGSNSPSGLVTSDHFLCANQKNMQDHSIAQ